MSLHICFQTNKMSLHLQPVVKPTAIRAKDANSNSATSISQTSTNSTASSQHQPLQLNKSIVSSTPSKPIVASSIAASTNVSSTVTNLTTSQPPTAAIQLAAPFAAVAKNSEFSLVIFFSLPKCCNNINYLQYFRIPLFLI